LAYRLEGTYYESCNCEVVCPCSATSLVLPADYDRCTVVLGFGIASGEVDGVRVDGCGAAMVVDAPKQMTDGGWRVGLFIDGATEEQREKLVSVFSGAQGGPAAAFGPLVGELLGVEYSPIEVYDDGLIHGIRVGEAIDLEVHEFGGADKETAMALTNVAHPANTTLTVAQAKRGSINAFGIEVDTKGKNGHAARFSWAA
jgi:hypothetical protein